jgi:polar amino acid transport system substrate-binding protein
MRQLIPLALAAFAVLAGPALSRPAHADVLDDIKARGTLVVGVKADYKPFGFRDPSGAIIGVEPDLAADIAQRLGVKLELVPVVSSNRLEFLRQGKTDLMLATMSDTPERRKIVQVIEPLYYADFVNVLLVKGAPVKSWADLKGKTLCGTSGAWYNKPVAEEYGAEIASFDGSDKPLLALRNGECIGYLYDQTFIGGRLTEADWQAGFQMVLPGIKEAPWAMAVANGQDRLAKIVTDATLDWMKTGKIIDLETKWHVQPTAYAARMHDTYKAK